MHRLQTKVPLTPFGPSLYNAHRFLRFTVCRGQKQKRHQMTDDVKESEKQRQVQRAWFVRLFSLTFPSGNHAFSFTKLLNARDSAVPRYRIEWLQEMGVSGRNVGSSPAQDGRHEIVNHQRPLVATSVRQESCFFSLTLKAFSTHTILGQAITGCNNPVA
ncbi:hypothetical protein BDY19DRAFT_144597 [Irpex rosettiformis]|uniref:Uncharacterized protein n=1 Tax=Irpex rosettiformis TaxID=378272 RepID=A0ACB8U3I5_9APHY|nr:hypothetical protein BDY19DRAFT_144597 [Irpex rosettiformis]